MEQALNAKNLREEVARERRQQELEIIKMDQRDKAIREQRELSKSNTFLLRN